MLLYGRRVYNQAVVSLFNLVHLIFALLHMSLCDRVDLLRLVLFVLEGQVI